MESEEPKKRGRGRPRKRRREEDNINNEKSVKKVAVDLSRWKPLVGSYVLKEFGCSGAFLGKVVYYDSGLYRVDYEDGDCEDLESRELRQLILKDEDFNHDLSVRRKRLDEFLLQRKVGQEDKKVDAVTPVVSEVSGGLVVENGKEVGQGEADADSSSDSCEYVRDEVDVPLFPPPELPPSSGNVGVPEEYVPHLFSVFTFLRSFNIRLFLSPFALDDLVGAINCCVQNTLIDAIHFALLRALRRRLEMLPSDDSESASKCLRCADWSLLDSLTWPVFLVHYFKVMGYVKGPEWKGFYDHLWKKEYYTLPIGMKLMILQVLCDDVLESMEVREEIDMREESEFGIDPDAVENSFLENGPRRVHPRYSKTSACKDREAMEIIAENQGTKSRISRCSGSGGTEGVIEASDIDVDENGDECRLCGMDGILLCCDGCPSSYHARCIGVVKMYIPDGPWYCPECIMNKLGPNITAGTSLKGAEMFGIDAYEQVFLSTCDHLLVLRASMSSEACLRYYSPVDVPKVLQALSSSVQHRSSYSEISNAIAQHWHVPQSAFYLLETMERSTNAAPVSIDGKISTIEAENAVDLTGRCVDNVVSPCLDPSACAMIQADSQGIMCNDGMKSMQNGQPMHGKLHEQIKMESSGSVSQLAEPSDITNQSLVDRSSATEATAVTTSTSANSVGSHIGLANGTYLPNTISSRSKESNHQSLEKVEGNSMSNCLYIGTFFKPHAYINQYVHGEFAASAASKLAVLSSEEIRVSEGHKPCNKKAVSDILVQVKAFSMAASRFFWPSSEKKLMEVPRERCGWCHSCKLSSSNRRGCMLNSAASTAIKGALKILNGLRPAMKGDSSLPSISAYILYMGEILSGLTVGPFLSEKYRKKWQKQIENASTYSALKAPLLELEENIRVIALSGDWVKAMDDLLVESSMFQSSTCTIGTTQKRGPNGKRYRKQSVMTDVATVGLDKSFIWWRGGKLSKLLFHKAILPCSSVKKAARQGGSRKISGIHYADDFEVPKRNRQLYWRAAVERSKNSSQLALQVRYLDLYVRWNDLIRPEQNIQEGKGSETEASFFRNAKICEKRMEGNKIRYGVAFGSQKHLPSRIMKNIIEVEQRDDGKEKYWFSEMHVPLYLIKEYEESLDEAVFQITERPASELSELQKRQLKASRRDIFSYLTLKRDKLESCSCASCHCDVLLRRTVKCSACQGFCHDYCTIRSTIDSSKEIEFFITCKQCYNAKAVSHNEKSNESSTKKCNESTTSPLLLQGGQGQDPVTSTKGSVIKLRNQPLVSVRNQESSCEMKRGNSPSSVPRKDGNRPCNWGVIWKKKHIDDTGVDFRRAHILLKGSPGGNRLRPSCYLCKKAYASDLMYIHCETCNSWFHADAVGLEESKISEVVGFKCCRCRRIKSPECPYDDSPKVKKQGNDPSKKKKQEIVQFPAQKRKQECVKIVLKEGNALMDFDSGSIAESEEIEPTTPMFPVEEAFIQDDDPLLFSVSRVEQIKEEPSSGVDFECNAAGPGPQKLPVRRQSRQHGDEESSVPLETNSLIKDEEMPPGVEWGTSGNDLDGDILTDYEGLNYEDMEFEPQTYFSYTELLAPDDGSQLDGSSASGNVFVKSENPPYAGNVSMKSEDQPLGDLIPQQYATSTSGDQQESVLTLNSAFNLIPSDGNHLDGFSASENASVNPENLSYAVVDDVMPQQYATSTGGVQQESANSAVNSIPCKMCSHLEPAPDLSCKVCGIVIHHHCSPWVECSPPESAWTCGYCREWR